MWFQRALRKCRPIPDARKLRQFGATGWWSKGDSNCEPLSDAFVNFSPFEGRGDANGDRPERADTLRSTGTTTDSYAPECGRRLYGSLAPGPALRRAARPLQK